MGSWGTGLYDDDTACDARDGWVEKLRLGTPPEIATTELIAEWEGAHDEPLFWLALAELPCGAPHAKRSVTGTATMLLCGVFSFMYQRSFSTSSFASSRASIGAILGS